MEIELQKRNLIYLESAGVVFTFLMMMILRNCYEISNGAIWSILFASINDSIWENIKIILIPFVFWSLVELSMLRVPLKNIIVSKGISLLVIMGSVILLMTIYLKISNGRNMLSDIMIFLFAIIMGHIISMLVMTSKIDMQQWSTLMLFAIVLVLTMVLTFTVNPPRMWIFEDNMTKSYGITQSSLDVGAYYLDKVRITSYF